jgi:hypothetical protein
MIQSLDVGIASAWAKIENLVFEENLKVLQTLSAGSLKLMSKLIQLYAFDRLERDMGFLALEGIVNKKGSQKIRNLANDLCFELFSSGDIKLVLEAFDVPNLALGPIARDYVSELAYASKL